jgi:hypothetical protein
MMPEQRDFYSAFFERVIAAGLEIRDHWHPDSDDAVTYKLRDAHSGKTMRYTIRYEAVGNAEAGWRAADDAVARFFNRAAPAQTDG